MARSDYYPQRASYLPGGGARGANTPEARSYAQVVYVPSSRPSTLVQDQQAVQLYPGPMEPLVGAIPAQGPLAWTTQFGGDGTTTLSFSGSVTKQTSYLLTGALTFVGNATKFIQGSPGKVSAALTFAGAVSKQAGKSLVAAALNFVGAAPIKVTWKALSAGQTSVAIVQTAVISTGSGASSATLTFGKTPKVGDTLFVIVTTAIGNNPNVVPPTGWTPLDQQLNNGATRTFQTFYRTVQSGDGTTYTFGVTVNSAIGVAGYELSGVAASPFNQSQISAITSLTTWNTASLTPSVLNCLPLAIFTNANSSFVSGIWTVDFNSTFTVDGQHGPVTTDTITAVNGQVTWLASTSGFAYLVLIAPATYGAAAANLSFSGGMRKFITSGALTAAALTFSGNITKMTSYLQTAGLTFSGNVTKLTNYLQTAGLTFNGAVAKSTGRPLNAALTFVGNVTKQTSIPLNAALNFTGSVTKQTFRNLAAALSFVGNIATTYIHSGGTTYTQAVAGALSFVGATLKLTSRPLASASLTSSGSVQKTTLKFPSASVSFATAMQRLVGKNIVASLQPTGRVNKLTARAFNAVLTWVGNLLGAKPSLLPVDPFYLSLPLVDKYTATLAMTNNCAVSLALSNSIAMSLPLSNPVIEASLSLSGSVPVSLPLSGKITLTLPMVH